MSQDYGPAISIPTSHHWSGRGGRAPRWIIAHGTAGGGSAEEIGHFFVNNDPPTSTHYVVGLRGEVVQCVAEADSAWGNGVVTQGHDPWWSESLNPNLVTLSIEHVKSNSDNSNHLTDAQKAASFALIKHLCDAHNIPKRRADAQGGITGHNSIDPVNRAFCPGPYPWDELFAYLAGGNSATPGVPSGWQDDGTRLTAPNGFHVILGFRAYVLSHAWRADDWPLEDERRDEPLDITNPSLGKGSLQHFRRTILAWQPSTNDISELYAGQIALAWEQRAKQHEQHP